MQHELIYSVVDDSNQIMANHVLPSIDAIQYHIGSVERLWAKTSSDPITEKLIAGFEANSGTLEQSEIYQLFNGNKKNTSYNL